jgi:hypothetical protein
MDGIERGFERKDSRRSAAEGVVVFRIVVLVALDEGGVLDPCFTSMPALLAGFMQFAP